MTANYITIGETQYRVVENEYRGCFLIEKVSGSEKSWVKKNSTTFKTWKTRAGAEKALTDLQAFHRTFNRRIHA